MYNIYRAGQWDGGSRSDTDPKHFTTKAEAAKYAGKHGSVLDIPVYEKHGEAEEIEAALAKLTEREKQILKLQNFKY